MNALDLAAAVPDPRVFPVRAADPADAVAPSPG